MSKLTTEILIDGTLRVDFGNRGFTIPAPVEPQALDAAALHLVEYIAGISTTEIVLAGMRAIHPEIA